MTAWPAIQVTANLQTLPIAPWAGLRALTAWSARALFIGGLVVRVPDPRAAVGFGTERDFLAPANLTEDSHKDLELIGGELEKARRWPRESFLGLSCKCLSFRGGYHELDPTVCGMRLALH